MVDSGMIMLIKDETVRICWKVTGKQCVKYPGIYTEGLRKAATLCKVIRCQECFRPIVLEHYPHISLLDIRTNIY